MAGEYNFVPGRESFINEQKIFTNIEYLSVLNIGEGYIYIKNSEGDSELRSTAIPPGGTYNTLVWAGNTWQRYAKIVVDATGSAASLEYYAKIQ